MKSASFLSSARTTSLLVLLVTYVSVDQASRLLSTADVLRDAHQALARAVVLEQVSERDLGGTIERAEVDHSCGLASASITATRVMITRAGHRRWRAEAYWCGEGDRDRDEPKRTLLLINRQLHLPASDAATIVDLFDAVEHQIIDERVNIAPLGFELRGDLTPWVIGPIVVGLLALMRNSIRRVLDDDDHAAEEPWLLVDAGSASNAWSPCCGLWRSPSRHGSREAASSRPLRGASTPTGR